MKKEEKKKSGKGLGSIICVVGGILAALTVTSYQVGKHIKKSSAPTPGFGGFGDPNQKPVFSDNKYFHPRGKYYEPRGGRNK